MQLIISGELESFEGLSVGESKRLKVFHSDPLDYHSIVDALKGCSGLFYSYEPPSDHPIYDVCFLTNFSHKFNLLNFVR